MKRRKRQNVIQTLRSRYGKLKKLRSGSGDGELTERDDWVLRNFEFLRPHIYEVQKKTFVSMKRKLEGTPMFGDDTENIADEIIDSASTSSFKPSDTTMPQSVAASKSKEDNFTEESLLTGLEERSQQMMAINHQLLERMKPSSNRERDTFVDWIKSVVNDFDNDIWRQFQQETLFIVILAKTIS
ncbi:unnamed protein product [Mytilus edulis]|uniref:Uncharacterized protein n=1 Tax=Mytilus edulis TaxID=6550 RepID=A0A8S3SIP7_MYTED|nr:unnamed protein product [Mytilus edulis]